MPKSELRTSYTRGISLPFVLFPSPGTYIIFLVCFVLGPYRVVLWGISKHFYDTLGLYDLNYGSLGSCTHNIDSNHLSHKFLKMFSGLKQ